MNNICLYICMAIIIICTLLMIASFIYREYWEAKLKKEAYKMKPKENGTMTIEEIREMYFNGRENE